MNNSLLALLGLVFLTSGHVYGQRTVVTPVPKATPIVVPVTAAERAEATGTISDLTPDRSLVLHTNTSGGEPIVFRFAPTVTYVDPDGKTVESAGLRKNLRVRVSYVKSGGDNIADKVTILD